MMMKRIHVCVGLGALFLGGLAPSSSNAAELTRLAGVPTQFLKFQFNSDAGIYYFVPHVHEPIRHTAPAGISLELECIEPDVTNPVWTKNGQPIVIPENSFKISSTGRKLQIAYVTPDDAGIYSVQGLSTCPLELSVVWEPVVENLGNSSARGVIRREGDFVIHGFALAGTGPRAVLIRAIGPTLTNFGLADALPTPVLRVHDGRGTLVATGVTVGSASPAEKEIMAALAQSAGAFPLASNSTDQVVSVTLDPGPYTAVVGANGNETGNVLIEVYVLPRAGVPTPERP